MKSTSAEYLEILRQYQSELDGYKQACTDIKKFDRDFPLFPSIEQEREYAYQHMLYKQKCQRFDRRKKELKKRMVHAGYGAYKLGQKDVDEAVRQYNFKNELLTNPELIREQIKLLKNGPVRWADEDIMARFNITKDQLDNFVNTTEAIAEAEISETKKEQDAAEVFKNMYRAKYGKDPE